MSRLSRFKAKEAFGLHMTLDGYECCPRALSDLNGIHDFLDSAPDKIGMTKIMPPYVFKYEAKEPDDSGVSGFVLIAESHISIHTFPHKTYLSFDMFSCSDFSPVQVLKLVKTIFKFKRHEYHIFDRGLEFEKAIQPVVNFMQEERRQMNPKGESHGR